ncbi:MAG: U32 family peptidase, partial [Chthoniobacterales bacterium]|nr:U32 family peptidase [Chthoniobacterales bacterium]
IIKAGEEGLLRLIERAKPDGVLVRNLGGVGWFQRRGVLEVGDFSLNVGNSLSALVFLKNGLERVTVAYDLTAAQVIPLAKRLPSNKIELVIHVNVPMFHMEHCVFAAFLSRGKDWRDCGRPCEKHRVALRDRIGVEHPVLADAGCRNTVFQFQAQTGASYLEEFVRAGIRWFRVELLNQDGASSAEIVRLYRDLVEGRKNSKELWQILRVRDGLGVTTGTLSQMF